jgi:two-component system nitrate/nitrite response regulator NarL
MTNRSPWCHDERVWRLLIVDDHQGFRSWARELLGQEGFDVVGVAGTGASAIDAVAALEPDVVLLDIQLPDMSGFDVAEQVAGRTTVVFTSSRSADDYGARLRESSAAGFVDKAEVSGELLAATAFGAPP